MQGLLLINKNEGETSFAVVAKVKRLLKTKRVGHTGTLDPMARGVLPVLVGRSTVLCGYLLDADKEYIAEVKLGTVTDTLDKTGRVLQSRQVSLPRERIEAVLKEFLGKQQQVPPMYSALKKDGVRLYELAREGKEVQREARSIEIYELELLDCTADTFKIRVLCSKGTYVRSLADDIGRRLGTGAILTSLIRTKTGGFTLGECIAVDTLSEEELKAHLRPSELAVAHYPKITVSDRQGERFINGGELDLARLHFEQPPQDNDLYRVFGLNKFLGLGIVRHEKSALMVKCLNYHPSDEL